jgi:hypothetical protein
LKGTRTAIVPDPLTSSFSLLVAGGIGSFDKVFVRTVLGRYPDINRLVVSSLDEPTAPASRRCSGPVSRSCGFGARLGDECARRRYRAWHTPQRGTFDARETELIPSSFFDRGACERILRLQECRVFDDGRPELMLGEQLEAGAASDGMSPNDRITFSVLPTPRNEEGFGGMR